MLELKKIELHHLCLNSKVTKDVKAALKLQLKTFMEVKYQQESEKAEKLAHKYVEVQTIKITEALKNRNIDRAENILNKYNNTDYKNHFMFTDMINSLRNEEIAKKFDRAIVKRLKTESEAKGLMVLAFENNVNSQKTYNQTRLYKALSNFDENNHFMSKAKILNSLKNNNLEDDNLTKAIRTFKSKCKNAGGVVKGTIGFVLNPVYELLNEYLQKQKEMIEASLGDLYSAIKNGLLFLKELVVFTVKTTYQATKATIDLIDDTDVLNVKNRRNLKKLRYVRT